MVVVGLQIEEQICPGVDLPITGHSHSAGSRIQKLQAVYVDTEKKLEDGHKTLDSSATKTQDVKKMQKSVQQSDLFEILQEK